MQTKFAASSVLPVPLCLATCGYAHSGRVRSTLLLLVCAAVNRMNAATAQLEAQELTEVAMRQRIAVATDYELRVKRRLNFQKSEIAYQKRIATLYGDIRRQAP